GRRAAARPGAGRDTWGSGGRRRRRGGRPAGARAGTTRALAPPSPAAGRRRTRSGAPRRRAAARAPAGALSGGAPSRPASVRAARRRCRHAWAESVSEGLRVAREHRLARGAPAEPAHVLEPAAHELVALAPRALDRLGEGLRALRIGSKRRVAGGLVHRRM